MKRAAIYTRVSTDDQAIENQLEALQAVAEKRGWTVVGQYTDKGISGSKGRQDRPSLDLMLKDASRGKFDVVMAWSVDRLGRSLQDLLSTLAHLDATGCDLYLDRQNLDTTTPAGRAMFQMLGVFSEFERAMIVERVKAGLVRARAKGTRFGRPNVSPAKVNAAKAQLAKGTGIIKTAKLVGLGVGTVQRIKREATIAQA